ncbi:MAG TPA: ABC transporter permease [Desulfosporosinus sp.]|nr:ABC transporter permease [Desulfosporosinus sp.]
MRFPNNNQAIIKKLTRRTLKAGKIRNIMVILAIVLTTTLFTSLFTIGMGLVETMQQETMRQAGGSAHASLKYLTDQEFADLKDHSLIKQIEYSVMLGMGENPEFLKHHTEIRYATDGDAKLSFSYPTQGRMPEHANELATDTTVLDLLGLPHTVGQKLTMDYSINGEKSSKEFELCGFWESDAASPASMVYVAQPFTKTALAGLDQKTQKQGIGTGLIYADILFGNSMHIEENVKSVITDSGYSLEEGKPNYISYGVNWSYMSTNFKVDASSILTAVGACILIIFTGYLIIYNIFMISVVRDIRFYGLLKTIGTTPKQIRKIIRNQALLLSAVGIPIGLMVGFLLGLVLLPIIMSISTIGKSYSSFSPLIFAGAAVFSLITVWLSCRRPGKIAGGVSPVDAVRYTEQGDRNKKLIKKSRGGSKIYQMAFANLARNKKKTALVVASMSLSLILLNSVFTLSNGFDMNKFVKKFVSTDFVIGHANLFNNNRFRSESDELSPKMIEALSFQEGIEGGGKLYYNQKAVQVSWDGVQKDLQLYGLEEFPFTQMNIVEGKLDLEKLKSGNYLIEGVRSDDNGKIIWNTSHYKIGDKVTITMYDGRQKEYEVLAKAEITNGFSVRYYNQDAFAMYLPASEFAGLVKEPVTMSYILNVDDQHTAVVENFLEHYTKNTEPTMDFESKKVFVDEFKKLQNMFLLVGGILSLIMGMIGMLNFINSILTGIIARRREFAMLQSIGMTDRQLCKMLMLEGLFYAMCTILITFFVGTVFSFVVIQAVASNLWFFSYQFIILPLLIASPLLILLSLVIPFVAYIGTNRQTIVERLRESE